jgi:5-enolpyruvylshikimate-3-phosphate synthase
MPAHIDLSTPAKRAKLKPRSAAYSLRISKGVAILLYVGKSGLTWRARVPGRPVRRLLPLLRSRSC